MFVRTKRPMLLRESMGLEGPKTEVKEKAVSREM